MQGNSFVGTRGAARFTGTLDDLSVADLIQILQLAGKGAVITITRDDRDSRLWCHEGAIIAAESGRLRGEAAVYRILSFEQGALVADLQPVAHERSIFAATQRLLLEGARRKDESALLREKLGDLQRCVQLREPGEDPEPDASAVELELLASFRSPRSLLEALEDSELGDFETLTALVTWLETGQLRDTGERYTPAPPAPRARQSEASLVPLVANTPVSTAPRRRVLREPSSSTWGRAALVALVLVPAGYLIGARTGRSLEPGAAPAAPASAAAEPAPRTPASYPVGVRVEPAEAELWLDGQPVGRGSFETVLVRDGVVHELRVSATGHVPARILFLGAPPPRELQLEPLPVAPTPRAAPAAAPASDSDKAAALTPDAVQPTSAAASEPPKGRKRAALRTPARRETARPQQRTRGGGTAAAAADAPRVQIIDEDPIIRVLD